MVILHFRYVSEPSFFRILNSPSPRGPAQGACKSSLCQPVLCGNEDGEAKALGHTVADLR